MKSHKLLRKADFLLAAALLAAAFAVSVLYAFGRSEGQTVVVSQDGKVIASYDLHATGRMEERIVWTDGGYNLLVIENGSACLTEADCPDLLCVHQGKISRNGEVIVCLPHRLVVEIKGGETHEVDAVVN